MNIHFFIPDLTPGGAEKVFATLCRLWDRTADEVTLVVLRKDGPYFAELPLDLRVVEVGSSRLLAAIPQLYRLWAKEKPDVVLATQAHVNTLMGWLSRVLRRTRFVGRETSVPSQARKMNSRSFLSEWVYRAGYRRLSRVICPSNTVSRELAQSYRLAAHQLKVVPNPVDVDSLTNRAREPLPEGAESWGTNKKVFVAAGRLETVKGFDLLLHAARLVPDNYVFVVLGDGRLRNELLAQAADLGVGPRIRFQGFDSNPHRWTARAAGFVLSSRYEGFPNAVLEAQALGVPVAAFKCPGGVTEILEEGITGTFAQPGDPRALAEAIRRVGESHWDSEALKARTRERFGGHEVTRRYRAILEEVING